MSLVQLRTPRGASTPRPAAGTRLRYLMNDFTVQEHVCNLRCSYCLNFENELKGGKPWVPVEKIALAPGTAGLERARQVLASCREHAQAPILRFSGGEVLAVEGAVGLICEAAAHWERVQVLTNATLLFGETLERLGEIESLNLCCSADGHTVELNALRVKQPKWAQRIIDGTLGAIRAGIPVEVNMVLTRRNVGAVYDFAAFLFELDRSADVKLLPFPVRGRVAGEDDMGARVEDCGALRRLIDEYDRFAAVLPPVAYLERLLRFYESGRRADACRVPLAYIQTFDDGVVASCPNCWSNQLGNALQGPGAFEEVGHATIHKLFLRDPPRFPFCKTCFTPFDVANVYFSSACTLEDLARLDLYSTEGVRARLVELKSLWDTARPQALWA
jgi:MoaA/NifB/PqqE/SkfB family radical SAM enzyme